MLRQVSVSVCIFLLHIHRLWILTPCKDKFLTNKTNLSSPELCCILHQEQGSSASTDWLRLKEWSSSSQEDCGLALPRIFVSDTMPATFLCHLLTTAVMQSAAIEKSSPAVRRPASVGRHSKQAPSKLFRVAIQTETPSPNILGTPLQEHT